MVSKLLHYSFNFIYFTTNTKQVIQIILIMLVGTNVCVRMVFVLEKTGVPGGNPPVWLGDHMTISHADAKYRTRVNAMRGVCINTAPVRQHITLSVASQTIAHRSRHILLSVDIQTLNCDVQLMLDVLGTDPKEAACEAECHTLIQEGHYLNNACPLVCLG